MAAPFPGDPYFPNFDEDEEYEPMEDMEDDQEVAPPLVPPMDEDIEEDPEEDPEEQPEEVQGVIENEAVMDEEPQEEGDEYAVGLEGIREAEEEEVQDNGHADGAETEDEDANDDGERGAREVVGAPVVVNPRYEMRSRSETLPPPSHRTYQDPNGLLWKFTPRKWVNTNFQRETFRIPIPPRDPPPPPAWVTQLET